MKLVSWFQQKHMQGLSFLDFLFVSKIATVILTNAMSSGSDVVARRLSKVLWGYSIACST